MTPPHRLLTLGTILLASTGCSNDDDTTPADTTSTSRPTEPTTSTPSTPDSPGTTSTPSTTAADDVAPVGPPQIRDASSEEFPVPGRALLTDVRLAGHDGFDRIVFEFDEALPGHRVELFDGPVPRSPPGDRPDVAGDTYLQVHLAQASGVDLGGQQPRQTYTGPTRLTAPHIEVVLEAVQIEDFEGNLLWVLGLEERTAYALARFDDPPRLVVDVFHPLR